MKILIATTNPGKLREIRAVMSHPALELVGLDDLEQPIDEPVEDGDTFEANAIIKAEHYGKHSGLPTLADDSGLEVDALGGLPGVRSARYAGVDGSREKRDRANNRKLLEELEGVSAERRAARFVCAMALAAPPGAHLAQRHERTLTVRGTIQGRILTLHEARDPESPDDPAEPGRGEHGFGYDPLFLVSDLNQTTAELDPAEKNRISHRGQATRAMWKLIQPLLAED